MKKTFFLFLISLFLVASCKKDDDGNTNYQTLTEEDISEITTSATSLAAVVQQSMFSYIATAADSGKYISYPSMATEKSTRTPTAFQMTSGEWTGPDANGWYTWHMEGAYDYTQRVRCNDSIIDYEYIIAYDGADGSYESITKTQYARYTENGVELYKGYWDWSISTYGDNDISDVRWMMTFDDWNPINGAGSFDWYWGASSNGGSYVPFYRYLNILTSDAGDEWLDVRITFYNGTSEAWSWEYTTPWSPVDMPELHTCGLN
jgi:hypothetical protein